jgi:hypothetical protein
MQSMPRAASIHRVSRKQNYPYDGTLAERPAATPRIRTAQQATVLNMAPLDQEVEVVQPAEVPDGMPLPSDPKVVFLGGLFLFALLATAYLASEIVLPFGLCDHSQPAATAGLAHVGAVARAGRFRAKMSMRPEHGVRRKIIGEWTSLPRDKRQTEEQAKPFAKKAMGRIPYGGDPYRRVMSWLLTRTGKA